MKLPSLLLGFCLIASGLNAYAPHPSVLTVKYGDQMLPVVRVSSSGPYVMVDGKEKLIRSSPVYLVQEAADFADNFVQARRGSLGGNLHMKVLDGSVYDASADYHGTFEFASALTAKQTIKSGFAVMVFYSDETFAARPKPAEVFVRALPELPAGKPINVKFMAVILPRNKDPRFFVQIFDDNGAEVPTSDSDHASRYYGLRDRARLARAIEKYLEKNKGADHAAEPVSMPKPVFSAIAVLPKGEVVVTLTIEPDGTVSAVDAGMIADDSARKSTTEALGNWLFLPKLKAGQPVSTYLKVPLSF